MLTEGETEVNGYVFGPGRDAFIQDWDPGVATARAGDADNPVGDDRHFGRDYLSGPVHTMEAVVNQYTKLDARRVLREIAGIVNDPNRLTPGWETVMRICEDGLIRRVYGRPRNFDPIHNGIAGGATEATFEFHTSDQYYYDDQERAITVQLVPPPEGGLTFPATAPLVFADDGENQGTIGDVGGEAPTPFQVLLEANGSPLTNPKVYGDNFFLDLRTTIPHDGWVLIDTRKRTALRENGTSVAGGLTRVSRLSEARLLPGNERLVFSGVNPGGTARATLTWRPAYNGF